MKDEAKKAKYTRGKHKGMVVVPYVKGLSEAFARILLVLLFFAGELDVASGINGVNVVRKIPHLTLLYQFQNIVHIPLPKFWFAFMQDPTNSATHGTR